MTGWITPGRTVYGRGREAFLVLGSIGWGRWGQVFKVRRKRDEALFVLKILPAAFSCKATLERLIENITDSLSISNDAAVRYHFFHTGASYPKLPPYILMDFAGEETLAVRMSLRRASGRLFKSNDLAAIFLGLIEGLEVIHGRVVHGDLKPANIFLTQQGLKISDYGFSALWSEHPDLFSAGFWGSERYLAPEGWGTDDRTEAMDIYALGVIFYEMATLKFPFAVETGSANGWQNAHLYQSPSDPLSHNRRLRKGLAEVILTMVEKRPEARFKTCDEIRAALQGKKGVTSPMKSALKDLLQKRLDENTGKKEAEAQLLAREQEVAEHCMRVGFQVEAEVLTPLRELVDGFNTTCENGEKVEMIDQCDEQFNHIFDQEVILASRNRLKLKIRALGLDDFNFQGILNPSFPKYKGREIRAWGHFKADNGEGFNLILAFSGAESYGEWLVLINRNNLVSLYLEERLPEPFAFEIYELFKEIYYLEKDHIYRSEAHPLDMSFFFDLIQKYGS